MYTHEKQSPKTSLPYASFELGSYGDFGKADLTPEQRDADVARLKHTRKAFRGNRAFEWAQVAARVSILALLTLLVICTRASLGKTLAEFVGRELSSREGQKEEDSTDAHTVNLCAHPSANTAHMGDSNSLLPVKQLEAFEELESSDAYKRSLEEWELDRSLLRWDVSTPSVYSHTRPTHEAVRAEEGKHDEESGITESIESYRALLDKFEVDQSIWMLETPTAYGDSDTFPGGEGVNVVGHKPDDSSEVTDSANAYRRSSEQRQAYQSSSTLLAPTSTVESHTLPTNEEMRDAVDEQGDAFRITKSIGSHRPSSEQREVDQSSLMLGGATSIDESRTFPTNEETRAVEDEHIEVSEVAESIDAHRPSSEDPEVDQSSLILGGATSIVESDSLPTHEGMRPAEDEHDEISVTQEMLNIYRRLRGILDVNSSSLTFEDSMPTAHSGSDQQYKEDVRFPIASSSDTVPVYRPPAADPTTPPANQPFYHLPEWEGEAFDKVMREQRGLVEEKSVNASQSDSQDMRGLLGRQGLSTDSSPAPPKASMLAGLELEVPLGKEEKEALLRELSTGKRGLRLKVGRHVWVSDPQLDGSAGSSVASKSEAFSSSSVGSSQQLLSISIRDADAPRYFRVKQSAASSTPDTLIVLHRPPPTVTETPFGEHPFYRHPRLQKGLISVKFRDKRVFGEKVLGNSPVKDLQTMRELLDQPTLSTAEAGTLVKCAERVASHLAHFHQSDTQRCNSYRALQRLGRRYMYLDMLFVACYVLGPAMHPDSWWSRLVDTIPVDWDKKLAIEPYGIDRTASLVRRVSDALKCLKTGGRPSPEVTVSLKIDLLCRQTSPMYYKAKEWESWRIAESSYRRTHYASILDAQMRSTLEDLDLDVPLEEVKEELLRDINSEDMRERVRKERFHVLVSAPQSEETRGSSVASTSEVMGSSSVNSSSQMISFEKAQEPVSSGLEQSASTMTVKVPRIILYRPPASTAVTPVENHPFYRHPQLQKGIIRVVFCEQSVLGARINGKKPIEDLQIMRGLLDQPKLSTAEAETLVECAERVASHLAHFHRSDVRDMKVNKAVERLGLRFLYLEALFSASYVLGPAMHPGSWWTRLVTMIPTHFDKKNKDSFSDHLAGIARNLSGALELLKEGHRPSPEVTVSLKKDLFCKSNSPLYFKSAAWHAWREAHLTYQMTQSASSSDLDSPLVSVGLTSGLLQEALQGGKEEQALFKRWSSDDGRGLESNLHTIASALQYSQGVESSAASTSEMTNRSSLDLQRQSPTSAEISLPVDAGSQLGQTRGTDKRSLRRRAKCKASNNAASAAEKRPKMEETPETQTQTKGVSGP